MRGFRASPGSGLVGLGALLAVGCIQPVSVLGGPDIVGEPFGPAVVLSDGSDPHLSEDELELFFAIDGDLFVRRRARVADAFGPTLPLTELNGADPETDPHLFDGDHGLVFTSYRSGGRGDLFTTSRDDRDAATPWAVPIRLDELASPVEDCCGVVAPGGTVMRFATLRDGTMDIYRTQRAPGDSWSPPTRDGALSTDAYSELPAHWRDDVLVMDSDRLGRARDIFFARAAVGEPAGPPTPVDSVNTEANERDGWLSADGSRLYFQSDRNGVEQIFVAQR